MVVLPRLHGGEGLGGSGEGEGLLEGLGAARLEVAVGGDVSVEEAQRFARSPLPAPGAFCKESIHGFEALEPLPPTGAREPGRTAPLVGYAPRVTMRRDESPVVLRVNDTRSLAVSVVVLAWVMMSGCSRDTPPCDATNCTGVCTDGTCEPLPPDCSVAACPTGFFCRDTRCQRGCAVDAECPQPGVCDTAAATCACAPGTHACAGTCAPDTSASACGPSCVSCEAVANATPVCRDGGCDFDCNAGFHRCGDECKSDLAVESCGSSCAPCEAPVNGRAVCSNGRCAAGCYPGFHRCGDECVSNTSTASCGTSCTPCPTPPNSTAICDGTSCSLRCDPGLHPCNGACVSNTSVDACGSWSCTPCTPPPNAVATCDGTSCDFQCDPGYHRCGNQCVSNTSLASCGTTSCTPCPASPPNSVATCDGTSCGFTCNPGLRVCDGQCVGDDYVGACGSSCLACPVSASAERPTCTAGTCGTACITSCNQACVDVQRDAAHCGRCGIACGTGEACVGGQCRPSCTGTAISFAGVLPSAVNVGGATGFRIAVGDLDNDGLADVVDNGNRTGLEVRLGIAGGGLGPPTAVSLGARARGLLVVDLDGDGWRDLVATREASSSQLAIIKNDLGTLAAPTFYAMGATTPTPAVVVLDLNHDGRLDVLVPTTISTTYVFSQSAPGVFSPASVFPTGLSVPLYADVGDFDEDGRTDYALASATEYLVMRQLSVGLLTPSGPVAASNIGSLRVADVTGDSKLDLVLRSSSTALVRPGVGDGTFGNAISVPLGGIGNVLPVDLDADGEVDLVTGGYDAQVQVALATAPGTWGPPRTWPAPMPGPAHVVQVGAGQYRGSAAPELFAAATTTISLLLNDGAGQFPTSLTSPGPGVVSRYRLSVGDFDGDGDLDVLRYSPSSGALLHAFYFTGNDTGLFTASGQTVPIRSDGLVVGRLNADALDDFITPAGLGLPNVIDVYLSPSTAFTTRGTLTASAPVRRVDIADVDADTHQDIVAVTGLGVEWFKGNGDGTFGARAMALSSAGSSSIEAIALSDLNLDGRPDLVVKTGGTVSELRVYPAIIPGGFATAPLGATPAVAAGGLDLFVADFDGDARLDVLLHTSTTVSLYRGNGNGTLEATPLSAFSVALSRVRVGDLNNDGRLDLVGGLAGVVVYEGLSGGGWSGAAHFGVGPRIFEDSLTLADVTADGRLDVLLTTETNDLHSLVGTCQSP